MRRRPSFLPLLLCLAAGAAFAAPAPSFPIGQVDFMEGEASLMRRGLRQPLLDIGTPLQSSDLITTSSTGRVVLSFDRATGMTGSLTLAPNTALCLTVDLVAGEKRTTVELFAGSVGAKVKKLGGKPSLRVETSNAIAGVRGTEFDVSLSLRDATLVTCSEGGVLLSLLPGAAAVLEPAAPEIQVPAGRAVERRNEGAPTLLDLDPGAIAGYSGAWIQGELAAVASDPVRAVAGYETRYSKLSTAFLADAEALRTSAVLARWIREDEAGVLPDSLDPGVLRDKKELVGLLMRLRADLFIFERVYFRLGELAGLAGEPAVLGAELRRGLSVAGFFAKVRAEAPLLADRIALYHYALDLYSRRNEGSTAFGE
jgi:hypothetical protein